MLGPKRRSEKKQEPVSKKEKGASKMKKLAYRLLQQVSRKLIDLLMSLWLWANKHEKAAEERKKYER